ncbi:hypothetical protein CLHOM_12710 [Clostridium homopropionicum DSM 5847]|uniref:Thioredoxin domain-containing protein n=1 Tax=Clostridium homopropionicum DSM 5847 TaxID=1121318 RepID=A0A0L6ZBD8_9CLOT|nr:hypothetical protein [Clostridium homopropionicum]KOA20275.1 hypothetical protein CLHOM_12710 [Clostridium homopropionicum DSM 5847]SFG80145.1 Thioredoxin [Clostridium homopropionicum]
MGKLNLTLRKYVFKVLIGLIVVIITTINHSVIVFSEENVLGNIPVKGLVSEEGLSSYTDEEFQKAPIRITVFSATWCPHCKELKGEFPNIIYSKYNKDTVAIRVWEIDSKEVVNYFQKFADKNQIPQEIKSQIPFIFINEKYPYLGYSKEITNNILEDIEAILNGKEAINGGNINVDDNSTESEETTLQYKVEKDLKTGEINQVNFVQAGMGDNFKSIFLILFSLLFFYFLSFRKSKKVLIGAIYIISILIFNILILSNKIPELSNVKYVEAIKIGLYILFGIIIGELIINFILGSRNNSKLVDKIIHIFNSKIVIILSFLSGFILMNSQIYNNNTYYSLIIKSIKGNQILLNKIYIGVLYSLGLILGNIVVIWIIKSALSILKGLSCNFKIKKYI